MAGGKKKTEVPDTPESTPNSEFSIILNKLTELCQKLGALDYIKSQTEEITKNYAFLSLKYDDQQRQMKDMMAENKEMRDQVSVVLNSLADVQKENRQLRQKLDDMEQYSRNSNLEVVGVPETPSEVPEMIATTIAKKLGVPVQKEDIEAAHRVASSRSPKPLVIRFKARSLRDKVLDKSRKQTQTEKLKAKDLCPDFKDTPVFINEHLTADRKKLITEARAKKNEKDYKYLWTKSGTIYMKKFDSSPPIKIVSTEDLVKLA
jgi:hypothetical protein